MIALPADDFASRVDLLVRQDHLRSEMGEARRELADALEAGIDVDQLRARVAQLERVVEQQVRSRPNPGGGASGDGSNPLVQMNRAVDEATGFAKTKNELSRLRVQLEDIDQATN
jgi:hypothetical protein